MEGEIHRMSEEDLAEVLEIQASQSFQSWSRESFASEIRNIDYSIPLVFKFGKLLGYMVVRIAADEAELCSIAVRPEVMGRGVAQAMLKKMDSMLSARNIHQMLLEVRASNARAIAFYRRSQFQDVGIRKGYYPDGEDALLMTRSPLTHV